MKNFFIVLLSVLSAGLIGMQISQPAPAPQLGFSTTNQTFSGMTNTRPTVASTTTLLLAANSGRLSATLCNPSTFNGYLTSMPASVTATTTVGATGYFTTSTGITIFPSTCYQFTDTGKIYGIIATTTSQTFSVAEIAAR